MPRYKGWLPTNEPACTHALNENWAWQTANKFTFHIQVCPLRLSLQRVRRFKHRMCSISLTYPYSYPLAAHSWRSWACQLNYQQNLCAAHIWPPHTPVHYTAILGMPIIPVPTFNWIFELTSSLKSNYALYHGTKPLSLSVVLLNN